MEDDLPKRVEAVLFASGRFLDAKHIAELLETKPKDVRTALGKLKERLESQETAIELKNEEDAWKLHVRDAYLDLVSKVVSDTEVSGPVLETLAIVAWRTPILQSEVITHRGTNAYEHVKELVERGFITKEPAGRSYKLRITEKFFEYFDVEGRDDIRRLFQEVEEEHRKKEVELDLQQKRLKDALDKAFTDEEKRDGPQPAEPDEPEEPEQKTLRAAVDLDQLDDVLEKARATRERIAAEMAELRPQTQDSEEPEGLEGALDEEPDVVVSSEPEAPEEPVVDDEPPEDKDLTLENVDDADEEPENQAPEDDEDIDMKRAKAIRERVEREMNKL